MNQRQQFTFCLLFVLSYGWSVPAATASEPVSVESLLSEMVDRESVARFPETDFRLKQQSSYNRASRTPSDKKGWFNNKDNNSSDKDKNFVRVEQNEGEKEWVIMEDEGPGAIVRTWMPFRNAGKPETSSQIRIYLDGSTEPTLQGNMLGLFNGTGVIPYPLAHKSLRSAVSFFPIPYATGCKITTTEQPFFYQITYRKYPDGTPVKTFTRDDLKADSMQRVGNILLNPNVGDTTRTLTTSKVASKVLASQQEMSLELPRGVASIRELTVKLADLTDGSVELPSFSRQSLTRSLVLKIEFDGQQTVWCPVGEFFGSGIGLNPFQGWYRTVSEDGEMSCRWVMPYRESAKISLHNLGEPPVSVELQAKCGDWKWEDSSMYFNAGWRGQYPVPTRPYSDWNYVTLKGRGVYVGDTLTVMNPVKRWWGEGDEKIFIDGEDFPSIFGTGTEDYYGYSWGGVSTDFYEHPFHAQPQAHVYNKLRRKNSNDKNTQGFSTETRTRSLDTMPFGGSLQLDMEVWSWTDCDMGYGVGVYWYGDATATSNQVPDPDEALNVPPLPDPSN